MQRALDEAGWTFFKGVLALTGLPTSRLFEAIEIRSRVVHSVY
jgi:hypothetical protein